MRHALPGLMLGLVLGLAACEGGGSGAAQGTIGAACYPNQTCNSPLVCVMKMCQVPAASSATGGTAGSTRASGGAIAASGGAIAASGGAITASGGAFTASGGAIAASGGAITASGGAIAASGGAIAASGGAITASGGAIAASGGAIAASGGAITASGGAITASGGAIAASGGAITASGGTQADPCAGNTCSGHGTCSGGGCTCTTGYGGATCNQCASGYGGYPNCTACACSTVGQYQCGGAGSVNICADGCQWSTFSCADRCAQKGYVSKSTGCTNTIARGTTTQVDGCWCVTSMSLDVLLMTFEDTCNDGIGPNVGIYNMTTDMQIGPNFFLQTYQQPLDAPEIECTDGDVICWGAWEGLNYWGCGQNCLQSCANCCSTCGSGLLLPVQALSCS